MSEKEIDALKLEETVLYETLQKAETDFEDFFKMLTDQKMELDIFRPKTLLRMVKNDEYTMRVFVRQCQNLSAVDNRVINIRN